MSAPRLTDDDLRQGWEAAAHDGEAAATADSTPDASACPDPALLWDAAHGELDPAETRAVVDHVAVCPACAEAWRLARHLDATAGADAVPAVLERPARPAASRRPWWLAAVAAVLVATVGIGLRDVWMPAGPSTFRGGDGATVHPRIADGAALPHDDFELAWEPVADAVEYDLRLTTDALEPVALRRGLEDPSYRVPPERLADLPDGALLFWQVEVVLAGGEREVSPTFEVRLESAGRSPP